MAGQSAPAMAPSAAPGPPDGPGARYGPGSGGGHVRSQRLDQRGGRATDETGEVTGRRPQQPVPDRPVHFVPEVKFH